MFMTSHEFHVLNRYTTGDVLPRILRQPLSLSLSLSLSHMNIFVGNMRRTPTRPSLLSLFGRGIRWTPMWISSILLIKGGRQCGTPFHLRTYTIGDVLLRILGQPLSLSLMNVFVEHMGRTPMRPSLLSLFGRGRRWTPMRRSSILFIKEGRQCDTPFRLRA